MTGSMIENLRAANARLVASRHAMARALRELRKMISAESFDGDEALALIAQALKQPPAGPSAIPAATTDGRGEP